MEKIRWLYQKDIKSILEIQEFCIGSPPWTKKDYVDATKAKKNSFLGTQNFPIIYVYELDKKVVGFIVYKIYFAEVKENSKISAQDFLLNNPSAVDFCLKNGSIFYANITNFGVHPDFRRKGIGKALFKFVIEKLSSILDLSAKDFPSKPFMLFSVVSEKDLGSLNFLKQMNFKANNILWNHCGKDHDAYSFCFQQGLV
jgi:ribosomal protein S18 acetylase RimI-like enzyme